uniref:Major facilitator superfamily (MFS) profile domain-containing protein n=1 Tax=Globisporangium ultimum (strain ATCC 200006 / CBS 805.95 / DAOM BR144) TaxID=431595 RepID=K3WBP8_GLOUD
MESPDRDSITMLGMAGITPLKNYEKMKHFDDMFEGGALRDGGAPRLFSRDYIGLVAQYAAVGLIDGVLPGVVYPFLQNYLNLDGTETTTAATLVQLAWSFKVFYGMLSDCFPIYGYRRRPYMIIGWAIAIVMLVIMAATPVGEPYYTDPTVRDIPDKNLTEAQKETINYAAAKTGSKYIVPMMLCAFGYLLADVCADGIVVELAQREPLAVRGTTQSVIYGTRTVFNILASFVVGFGMNGVDYGGDFSFSISFPIMMLGLTVVMAPMLPITWMFIREERVPRVHLREYIRTLWQTVQTRAVYQVIAYTFFSGIFARLTYVSRGPIQSIWVKVQPINEKISGLAYNGVFAGAIWFTGKYGLHWDWRWVPVYTMIAFVVLDATCVLFTVWGVSRAQWFWLAIPVIEQIPMGISFIVSTFVIIELSTEGHEGAMYGLLTTVSNLATPFATAITKNVDSLFTLDNNTIKEDSTEVRRDITITVLLMYVVNLLSLFWLVLLPRQKEETQMLKRLGGSSHFMGTFTVCYLVFALAWSVTTNLLSIFESTSCLTIAGGNGC